MFNDTAAKDFVPRRRERMKPRSVESADRSLWRAVLARLMAHPLVSTDHIEVAANSGHVTLLGYVTSNAQKDAARAAARDVEGVEQVDDTVLVAVPCFTYPYH